MIELFHLGGNVGKDSYKISTYEKRLEFYL